MTLTFPPKTITKSKTCNGDEWLAEEKGNKRKMSKLSEKAFAPPWDLGCFLWNCDCSIWQKEPIWNFGFFSQFQFQVLVGLGEHFMQSLGHKGDNGGIQVASEMSQIFSLLLIWVKTDWTQPVSCNFTAEKEIYLVPLTERLHPILIISRSQSILKEKCGLLFPRW